ncbi:WD40 repeat domain-containing protein [Streptomyces sp. NPDC096033]|uniref:WD40 repeat domain-containing protein n=1 Tax=Streptomyces sp. NPDC096033 TaxID=3366071 RepID=UPI00381FCA8A
MSEYFFYVAHRGSGQNGNGVSAIDPGTGQVAATIALGAPRVRGLVAAPGGKRLYALVEDRVEIRVIDLEASAVVGSIDVDMKESWDEVNSLAISADGGRLFAGRRYAISEIDTKTGKTVRTFEDISYGVDSLAPSRDGKYLYVGSGTEVLKFDLATGKRTASHSLNGLIAMVLVSPDGSRVYAATQDPSPFSSRGAGVFALDSGSLAKTAEMDDDFLSGRGASVASLPDGKQLLVQLYGE